MLVPCLRYGYQLPSAVKMQEWGRLSPLEKQNYWKVQTAINFIQSLQYALSDPNIQSQDFNRAIACIRKRAEARGVVLPAGEFYQSAISKSVQVLAKEFHQLPNAIHTTAMPFNANEIMEVADQAVLTI